MLRPTDTKPRLIAAPRGGLGNQLFNLVATLSVANAHGWDVEVDLRQAAHSSPQGIHSLEGLMPSQFGRSQLRVCEPAGALRSLAQDARRRLAEKSPRVGTTARAFSSSHLGYEPVLNRVGPGTRISGYFQTFAYAQSLEHGELRRALSLKSPSNSWRSLRRELADQQPVALHIRRGDYASSQGFGILDTPYYVTAMQLLQSTLGNRPVWIFTDDPSGANNDFPSATRIIGPELNPAETLDLMSRAAGLVIANSSLSWWSAWLAEPTCPIVTPSRWFAGANVDVDALLPPRWTRLAASFREAPPQQTQES